MNRITSFITRAFLLSAVGIAISGCSTERAVVTIDYTLQPSKGLPAGLKQVAIAPAELGPATDAKWSDMTADMIQNLIEQSRDEFGTSLRIADRVEAAKVFQEADLSAAGLTSTEGGRPAKLLGVQGYIVSKIDIKEHIDRGTVTVITGINFDGSDDGGGGAIETGEVEKVKRTVTAQATFKLIDAATGEVWASHSDSINDVEETQPFILFGSGEGEAGLTPTDQIAASLVERSARRFVSKLIPCRAEYDLVVISSLNESCVQGVRCLRADLYEEALDHFSAAIASDPQDHAALYGAGVANEALGNYDKALKRYRMALALSGQPEYAEAKNRLAEDLDQIK